MVSLWLKCLLQLRYHRPLKLRFDPEEWNRCATRLCRGRTWHWCEHVTTRLGLPPSVHNRAALPIIL